MIEWRDIKNFEGYYQVSRDGRVRSLDRICARGFNRKGKILKTSVKKDGYVHATLFKHGTRYEFKVHRLVAEAFVHNTENKPFVNHIDSDRANNRAENLEWCTQKENMMHARAQGRMKTLKGSECYSAKISERDVLTIRELHRKGMSNKEIATRYPLSASSISGIITKTKWKHI